MRPRVPVIRSTVERARPVARSSALGLSVPPASVSRRSTATPRTNGPTASPGVPAPARASASTAVMAGIVSPVRHPIGASGHAYGKPLSAGPEQAARRPRARRVADLGKPRTR
ncbi:hypothetical protein GCM10010300_15160 [Streptomyces olivaceoviridis]|nr:hypothetical protein GCM10010300_15160 [Streptomyces olivaceoviridis]